MLRKVDTIYNGACILVSKDRVVKLLQLPHSVAPQVYEIVFDVTHTKLLTSLCGLQGDRSCGVSAANTDQEVSLMLHAVASSLARRSIVLLLCKQLQESARYSVHVAFKPD